MCLFVPFCCVLLQVNGEYRFPGIHCTSCQRTAGSRPPLRKPGSPVSPSQREPSALPSSLRGLGAPHSLSPACESVQPSCSMSSSEARVHQQGCTTAGKQVLGRRSHPGKVTHLPPQHPSMPSMPRAWHTDTSLLTPLMDWVRKMS